MEAVLWNGSQVLPVNTAGLASEAPIDQQSCYRIIAFNAQGDSTPSNVACVTTIAAPTSLAATAVGQAAIDLSWRDNSTAEDGYEVNRGIRTRVRGASSPTWQRTPRATAMPLSRQTRRTNISSGQGTG